MELWTDMEIDVLRAEMEWQRAGAYYVRIQAMAKKYNISLREEFDGRDGDGCRYIVLLDKDFPVATCRFYDCGGGRVSIGRVVVLQEYRGRGLGRRTVKEAEKWAKELGFSVASLDSRDVAVDFYKKLGYRLSEEHAADCSTFNCLYMQKNL